MKVTLLGSGDAIGMPAMCNCEYCQESEIYRNADLFFVEGQLFDANGHADQELLEKQINEADPVKTILLSNSEHLNQMHTKELKKEAEKKGFEIWSDFESVEL